MVREGPSRGLTLTRVGGRSVFWARGRWRRVRLIVWWGVGEVFDAFGFQGFADQAVGEAAGIALAGQDAQQAAGAFGRVEASGGGQAFRDEFAGGGLLLFGGELLDGVLHGLVGDAALAEFGGEGPAGEASARMAGLDPGPGEGFVVDQSDLGVAAQHPLGDLLFHALAAEGVGELGARTPGESQPTPGEL